MAVTTAKLVVGSVCSEVRLVHLDHTRAVFFGQQRWVGQFVRLRFKVEAQWFDVEGVVVGRPGPGSHCMCTVGFAALPSATVSKLEQALKIRRSSTQLEAIREARRENRPISLRPQDERRRPTTDLDSLFRDALKDVA